MIGDCEWHARRSENTHDRTRRRERRLILRRTLFPESLARDRQGPRIALLSTMKKPFFNAKEVHVFEKLKEFARQVIGDKSV